MTVNPSTPPEPSDSATQKDHRVFERYPSGVPTVCQPATARTARDLKWSAKVQNVSLGGIALALQRRFERGTALAVELPDGDSDFYTTFVKVVHLQCLDDGSWLHGCAFVGQLSDEDLKMLRRTANGEPGLERPAVCSLA
jgi:hypothetical protein